jgi:hypothetical protein
LDWADEDTHAEWVDGEVEFRGPASDEHQDVADFLTSVMRVYVEHHDLGWVRSSPFQMKTGPDLPGREPDVLYLTRAHMGRLKRTFLDGPAPKASSARACCPASGSASSGCGRSRCRRCWMCFGSWGCWVSQHDDMLLECAP